MKKALQFYPYQFDVSKPIVTARGVWSKREGIWIRLEGKDGRVGFSEVAPIPGFPGESVSQAIQFLKELKGEITEEILDIIPSELPCLRYALGSALEMLEAPLVVRGEGIEVAALLPSGADSLCVVDTLLKLGYRTFKWKMGVMSSEEEMKILVELLHRLPDDASLRLDANGGLLLESALLWLAFLENFPIEFLEQPLPCGEEVTMLQLAKEFRTPMALDESIASEESLDVALCFGWRGPIVLKPLIFGSPGALSHAIEKIEKQGNLVIFSSAFETAFGFESLLCTIAPYSQKNRAMGLGTLEYVPREFSLHQPRPRMFAGDVSIQQLDNLWKSYF